MKEGSVAPKERVKITYKPDIGDAMEERELPHRMMIMGDFTGRTEDTTLEERQVINIDKYNFEEVLANQNISVDMVVPNELSEKGGDLDVHLEFRSMKDFSPDSVARQVPELRQLLEMREALVALKAPLSNNVKFRKSLQQLLESEDMRRSILEELGMDSDNEE
jgi:type VI secretion system protein ImpB